MNIKYSFLFVSYNCSEILSQCVLKSLDNIRLKFDESQFEFLVGDNSTSEEEKRKTKEFCDTWNIKYFHIKGNRGFGFANNFLAKKAKGALLILINPDCYLFDKTVPLELKKIDIDEKVLNTAIVLNPDGSVQSRGNPEPNLFWLIKEKILFLNGNIANKFIKRKTDKAKLSWFSAAFWIIPRQAYLEVGGFDENIFMYYEDVEFCIRWKKQGGRLNLLDSASVIHLRGGTQRPSINKLMKSVVQESKTIIYIFNKHQMFHLQFLIYLIMFINKTLLQLKQFLNLIIRRVKR